MKRKKKVCWALDYFDNFLTFISAASGCVLNFAVASLVDVPVSITSSAAELRICALTCDLTCALI